VPDPSPGDPEPTPLPNDSQQIAVVLAGAGRTVLEIGCGAGHVTERLVANGCTVTGIEIDPEAAEAARAHAAEVHVADLDLTSVADVVGAERRFGRIVVGDVFEHLKDPERTLRQLTDHLEPDGFLVSSIPNVTHADVRLMLLSGQWRTQDQGLLDRTHLRFFDRTTVIELFHRSGWHIDRFARTVKPAFESEIAGLIPRSLFPDDTIDMVEADPEASTYQFVVVARPGPADPADFETFRPAVGPVEAPEPTPPDDGTERLLAENEYLRIRVRELEERLEDALWVKAIWRDRAHRLSSKAKAALRWPTSGSRNARK
jgi:2-polyprenyl-3-methyl-5-hydroxy-6-metoxy-1,4-benzoquinol methylase